MGLIKATIGATKSVMAEQWKEFFMCEAIESDIIMVRGEKVTGKNSSNVKSDDNVISDGSVIAVADGQTAIVVSGGKITDIFNEPGEHVLHGGSPSLLGGVGAKTIGKDIIKRVGFGGDIPATTQRIYYVNCKEIPGNPFNVTVPFHVVDENIGLDMDSSLEASGVFSFKVVDPEKIYKTLMGNVASTYRMYFFTNQLKTEVNTCFMRAVSKYSPNGYRPSQIEELSQYLAENMKIILSEDLLEKRGIEIVSVAFDSFRIDALDLLMISNLQSNKVLTDPAMAAATLSDAQSQAMESAASNTWGRD